MAASSAHKAQWVEWKQATFGTEYMIWHDGLSVDNVTHLKGEARAEAVRMLRLGLSLGDAHAAEALSAMAEPDIVAEMRAQLPGTCGSERVRIALAIHRAGPAPDLARELVDVLASPLHWSHRIDAALGLRHFQDAESEAALLEALSDPEYLVRNHACESLLARWEVLPEKIVAHPAIFPLICGPREGDPTAEHVAAFAQARTALLALRPTGRT